MKHKEVVYISVSCLHLKDGGAGHSLAAAFDSEIHNNGTWSIDTIQGVWDVFIFQIIQ